MNLTIDAVCNVIFVSCLVIKLLTIAVTNYLSFAQCQNTTSSAVIMRHLFSYFSR